MRISKKLMDELQSYLETINNTKSQELLEEIRKTKKSDRRIWDWSIWGTTILVFVYFIVLFFTGIKNRIQIEEIVLFAIILLFNSELIDRIQELVINRDGISVKLEQLKQEVETNKADIQTNKTDIHAQEGAIQRIATAPAMINNEIQEKNYLENLVNNSDELKHLYRLYEGEQTDKEVHYKRQGSFDVELRRLRTLGLIENQFRISLAKMPSEGNLKDYIKLTPHGKNYVESRIRLGLENPKHQSNPQFWDSIRNQLVK